MSWGWLSHILKCNPQSLKVKSDHGVDPQFVKIVEEVKKGEQTNFRVQKDGVLELGNWLCVPNDYVLKWEIMDLLTLFIKVEPRCTKTLRMCIGETI